MAGDRGRGGCRCRGAGGDLPFITAFVDDRVDASTRRSILAALRSVADEPAVRLAIESQCGFRLLPEATAKTTDWPGWRGPNRDAVVDWLPDRLPDPSRTLWTCPLFNEGVGGVAVVGGLVLVGDRDAEDERDLFHAIDADTGLRLWTLDYEAAGHLDYGNSPRATPLIHGDHGYLLGAFGQLHCVRLADGSIVWRRRLRDDFDGASELVWGVSASPLIIDGKLIVNPGSRLWTLAPKVPGDLPRRRHARA